MFTKFANSQANAKRNLREIAQQLGVAHLLEGSEQRACGKVRVNAQLIDPDPKRDIGLQIMSYFHYSGDVKIITCKNLDDATKILS
jgi:hypothetical protein